MSAVNPVIVEPESPLDHVYVNGAVPSITFATILAPVSAVHSVFVNDTLTPVVPVMLIVFVTEQLLASVTTKVYVPTLRLENV